MSARYVDLQSILSNKNYVDQHIKASNNNNKE